MKLKNTEILQFRKDSKFKLKLIKKADKTWIYLTFYKTGTQLDMGGEKITNLATPTSNTDAATKKFVDDEVAKTIDSHSLKNEL